MVFEPAKHANKLSVLARRSDEFATVRDFQRGDGLEMAWRCELRRLVLELSQADLAFVI